ncbi:MAG: GlgB N-terminal domain-containing protein [Rhodoferax sp.]
MTLHDHDLIALMHAEHTDPFGVLGMHTRDDGLAVHALLPGAEQVDLIDRATGLVRAALKRQAGSVVFGVLMPDVASFEYQLRVQWASGPVQLLEDPYRFTLVLQDLD